MLTIGRKTFSWRTTTLFLAKAAFSLGMLVFIYRRVVHREGVEAVSRRLSDLHLEWMFVAVILQLLAAVCSVTRWERLLYGQGIHAAWRFLTSSFFIARFWGAFTPGGF